MSFTNVLNDDDISLLLQNQTVTSVLSSDAVKTRFRISLPLQKIILNMKIVEPR
jgi:hypothetical protein